MGVFKGGDENINRSGRKPGTLNNYTKMIKEAYGRLLENNLDEMSVWLAQVAADDPKSALDLLLKMSERFVPKLSQKAITDGEGGDLFKNVAFKFGPPIDSDERESDDFDLDKL